MPDKPVDVQPMGDSEAKSIVGGSASSQSQCNGTGPPEAPHGYMSDGTPWSCYHSGCPAAGNNVGS